MSEDLCGEFRFSVYQYYSLSLLFPRSIAASLTVVYSASTGVVSKGNHMQIKASLSTIVMKVDPVVELA